MQAVEDRGGAVAAIEQGFQKREIERSAYRVARQIDAGERVVVGVNRFTLDEEEPYEPLRVDPAIEAEQATKLATLRAGSAQPIPSQFADGGNLENTGIAALLAYSDIDSIIAFINPMTVMQPGAYGVADGHGGFIPGTTLIVDACIPPLFGYQPYETGGLGENEGYVRYDQSSSSKYQMYANNQVFEAAAFPALLQGLWAASGSGSYARPAIFTQRLAVRPNTWFGVTSAREVTVVWSIQLRRRMGGAVRQQPAGAGDHRIGAVDQ